MSSLCPSVIPKGAEFGLGRVYSMISPVKKGLAYSIHIKLT
jgi:hypothetical protein